MANTKKMDYVLLGLLSHEPMTGYEMKKGLILHSVFSGAGEDFLFDYRVWKRDIKRVAKKTCGKR